MLFRFVQSLFLCISLMVSSTVFANPLSESEKVELDTGRSLLTMLGNGIVSLSILGTDDVLRYSTPGFLVPSVIARMASMNGTREDLEFLVNIAIPVLDGVQQKVDKEKLSKNLVAFEEASRLVEASNELAAKYVAIEEGADDSALNQALLTLAASSQAFIDAGHNEALKNAWNRYGRWSGLSSTLCEPWILPSLKIDVLGASKIIPYGPLPIANEKQRNNLGEMSNHFFLVATWFHVIKSLSTFENGLPTLNGTTKVASEIVSDISEIGRGPLIVTILAANGEFALSLEASKAFLREIYEAVNRNRKIFTLHPVGTAYLYAGLNVLATPLLILDFKGFYLDDISLRVQDLREQKPYTVQWYSRVFILVGKATTPVFVVAQFYDKGMATRSLAILNYLGEHVPLAGRAARGLVHVARPLAPYIPAPVATVARAAHQTMGVWGPRLYNAGNYITGCAGAAFVSSYVLYEFLDRFFQNTIYSVASTASIVALYAAAYTQAAANTFVYRDYSVKRVAIASQTAAFGSLFVYDYVLSPVYQWWAAEPAEKK